MNRWMDVRGTEWTRQPNDTDSEFNWVFFCIVCVCMGFAVRLCVSVWRDKTNIESLHHDICGHSQTKAYMHCTVHRHTNTCAMANRRKRSNFYNFRKGKKIDDSRVAEADEFFGFVLKRGWQHLWAVCQSQWQNDLFRWINYIWTVAMNK